MPTRMAFSGQAARLNRLYACLFLTLFPLRSSAQAADDVWIEGEAPASINVKPNIAGWGHPEFLSGEKWLHVSIDADKVDREVPDRGGLIRYAFDIKTAGGYEVWNRIGFEFVRTPFEWRVDGGEWAAVSPEQLTTDCMELDFWCEVAWLKMGERTLAPGAHTLEIRLPKTKDAKGGYSRILYASDCLCLSLGTFTPNSYFKPGESRNEPLDMEAAAKVFDLPEPKGPAGRSSIPLNGVWQVCRNDENLPPPNIAVPMKDFPAAPRWTGIRVPGDKNEQRPDLLFAHRLWYRTRVNVPASCAGRSFHLVFPCNNLNTTVFVNGVYCGFEKNPYCRFQVDVTKAVKPGVNEIWVGIRDAWYGYTNNPKDPMKLRRIFNLPLKFFGDGFQRLAYPVWNAARSGILNTPEFGCAGAVKTTDLFVKPSVANKRLDAEVTLLNTTDKNVSGEIAAEAVNEKTGQVEKTFPAAPFKLASGEEKTFPVSGAWANPKLWWPDDPSMYVLHATVKVEGRPVDTFDQPFGFREWGVQGDQFTLNGVVWPIWCDLVGGASSKEEWLQKYRATHQRSMRLMGAAQGGIRWMGMTTDEALDWFDRNGVVVRRCGPLDGEAIGYMAIEEDPDLKALYRSDVKMDLMNNWRDQMAAQVKGERNHPSIMLWSIENEWLYINCINLYGGMMDAFEKEVAKCSDAVRAMDPTRLTMTDGGGANKDQSMPVHGNHYVFGDRGYDKYPSLAYEVNPTGGGRGRWVWDQKRPRFIGEDYFATGINPADYAIFGGEAAFLGKTEARPAAGLVYRMLTEGYRWAGQSAWQFWLGDDNVAGDPWISNSPRAVFCRQWNWTFGSGQKILREFRIFNSTQYHDPITFTWALTFGGKKTAGGTKVCAVPPGGSVSLDIELPMPPVTARQEGALTLTLTVSGKQVFKDVKAVSVLPSPKPAPVKGLLVYDPLGETARFLKARGTAFTPVASLANLPATGKVLIVGRDALSVQESTSSRLAAWAAGGRRVIVLEQKNPLRYQGIPAEMEPSDASGQIAFGEDMNHPALKGLAQKDFFTWEQDVIEGKMTPQIVWALKNPIERAASKDRKPDKLVIQEPDMMVYRNAYRKPTRGAKSLIQCNNRLQNSALVEVPVGSGLMLLCQMLVEERMDMPVAQKLLCNLIDYAAGYRQEFRPAVVVDGPDGQLAKVTQAIGLQCATAADPLAALAKPGVRLAVIVATSANLKTLAANLPKVDAFTQAGGYIVLNGLTPEGLADYNRLVGFDHMIRPFGREKVTFPSQRHLLTSGLTTGDIVMLSGERIFGWTSDEFVVSDEFSYIVDLEDVAPFMKFPNDFAALMVNGFRNADAWKYIVNLPLKDADWTLTLPKPQPLAEVTWVPNQNYNYATKFSMTFDGKETRSFDLKVNNDPQTFSISPPVTVREVRLKITDVQPVQGKGDITGLDNLSIRAKRAADFRRKVRPLLNIGAMVEYPRGAGGIVLCNLKFQDAEAVPLNAVKKRTIFAALLRNLKAPFFGGKTLIAGANLTYAPIDISKQATQYRDERGWFGDRNFTFKDLPTGRQTFAGVVYQIYDFPTSPVPTAIMLGGGGVPNNPPQEVKGIPINRKADALFFLHAARLDARMNEDDRRNNRQFEMAKYVVHYADGQTAEIPILTECDIEDYRQQAPRAIPGAQIAWTKPYDGTEYMAVAYAKQWNNPRPNMEITSLDMVYGKDRRGIPALLAVTAATTGK
jgi:hypothetical protein